MFRTTEERLTFLENLAEKQAFQLKLLHSLVRDQTQFCIYHHILASNMSERSFKRLQHFTKSAEEKLLDGEPVTLQHFISDFKRILSEDDTTTYVADLSNLIPHWLENSSRNLGFSQPLYEHFYAK